MLLDFVKLIYTTRTPHGVYVRGARRNRIDPHGGGIERRTTRTKLTLLARPLVEHVTPTSHRSFTLAYTMPWPFVLSWNSCVYLQLALRTGISR